MRAGAVQDDACRPALFCFLVPHVHPHVATRTAEHDRLHAIAKELNRLGGKVVEFQDSLEIDGVEMLEGGVQADSFSDHRMAMMLAIASQKCRLSISIRNPGCVSKSYPGFFDDFRSLGGTTE